jgi:hypothetical protein
MLFHIMGGSMWLLLSSLGVWQLIRTSKSLKVMTGKSLMDVTKDGFQIFYMCGVAIWTSVVGIVGIAHIYAGLCDCTWTIDPIYGFAKEVLAAINIKNH